MDIRQIQREIQAIQKMAKSEEITNFILSETGGEIDSAMSLGDRKRFIKKYSFFERQNASALVQAFIDDTLELPSNTKNIDSEGMGRELMKRYSVNEIFIANTIYGIVNEDGVQFNKIVYDTMPLILKPRKQFKDRSYEDNPKLATDIWKIGSQDGKKVFQNLTDGENHRIIWDTDSDPENVSYGPYVWGDDVQVNVSEVQQFIENQEPDFELTLDEEAFQKIIDLQCGSMVELGYSVNWSGESSYEPLMTSEEVSEGLFQNPVFFHSSQFYAMPQNRSYAMNLKTDIGTITIPTYPFQQFIAWKKFQAENKGVKIDFPVKIKGYKRGNGYLFDSSEMFETRKQIPLPDGTTTGMTFRFVQRMFCLEVYDYDLHPSLYYDIDLQDVEAQPPTMEEVIETQVETLSLPVSILARQMRVEYKGKRAPISSVSLDKWSKSDMSYDSALKIIGEHLDFYTIVKDGERKGNGVIYAQTQRALAERLTTKGKLDELAYTNVLSKYAFTIEETFFNLNPDFTDPEKLLGYFLGMGITKNALALKDEHPYRILCARLLGIDYFQGYSDLCKSSCIAGHLFIDGFDENGKPIFVSADTLLQSSIFDVKARIGTQDFAEKCAKFFGEASDVVLQNHELLAEENSPIFMKFHQGTLNEYESLVAEYGVGMAYKGKKVKGQGIVGGNQENEITRLVATQGLFPEGIRRRDRDWDLRGKDADGPAEFVGESSDDSQSTYVAIDAKMLSQFIPSLKGLKYDEREQLLGALKTAYGFKPSMSFDLRAFEELAGAYSRIRNASLFSKASEKVSYNSVGKREGLMEFYVEPMVSKVGPYQILNAGLSMTNTDLGPIKEDRRVGIVQFDYDLGNVKALKKKDKGYVKAIKDGITDEGLQTLVDLGLIDAAESDAISDELGTLMAERAIGLYREIKSQARIEGDELMSYALATNAAVNEEVTKGYELLWNMKYNNYATKPLNRVPIFLENMRYFGKLEDFSAEQYLEDGRLAGFSLRDAQKEGLKFLGAGGNSGLLAHEVGFGKTTSSIAKVSDMFLRGDAKRILISVPHPVYGGRNWEIEIQGDYYSDGTKKRNGLLPSNVHLVKLGTLDLKSLRGEKINESHPDWAEKSEGTEYNGPVRFTDSELMLIQSLSGSIQALLDLIGGANVKYGPNSPYLTPAMQAYGLKDRTLHAKRLPFFSQYEDFGFDKILRLDFMGSGGLDYSANAEAGNPAYQMVNDAKDFWNKSKDDTMFYFGSIDDLNDPAKSAKNSFIVAMKDLLLEQVPDLKIGEDGGELKILFNRFLDVKNEYQAILQDQKWDGTITKSRPFRRAKILGGALFPSTNAAKVDGEQTIKHVVQNTSFGGDGKIKFNDYLKSTALKKLKNYTGEDIIKREDLARLIAQGVIKNLDKPQSGFWPFMGTRSFYERIFHPWAVSTGKKDIDELASLIDAKIPLADLSTTQGLVVKSVNAQGQDELIPAPIQFYDDLAIGQLRTAFELRMTEEVAFMVKMLQSQAPLFLGQFKEWALRPNTILLSSHRALDKINVPTELVDRSVKFLAGFDDREESRQTLHIRKPNPYTSKERIVEEYDVKERVFSEGVLTRKQEEKLFLSKYRGMAIGRLNCDAFVVDEVHNFNRAFKKVEQGTRLRNIFGQVTPKNERLEKETKSNTRGMIRMQGKGNVLFPTENFEYNSKANYSVRAEVQNFIAICMYFQERAKTIGEGQKRRIENTIFLSATPFTDDNFQMLSLFGALSQEKLAQANINNTFDFFQVYANELWQKDIDYQNQYTLFPKIVGYKNVYALSNLIRNFTNFKISDKEINRRRPHKVIIGTDRPKLDKNNEDLNTLKALVPYNDIQKKMNADLERYITLDQDTELSYTKADVNKAQKIAAKLKKKAGDEADVSEQVNQLLALESFTLKLKKKALPEVSWDLNDGPEVLRLSEEILEIDPENDIAKAIDREFNSDLGDIEIGGLDKEEIDEAEEIDEEGDDNAGGKAVQDKSKSKAQQIAQRALEASRTQQLTLISPYYLTIANDKKLMNPYLPTLDGTDSENAKRVIENSPKLLYACKAIVKVLNYKLNEAPDAEKQFYGSDTNRLLGQVVYCDNYQFGYHGRMFNVFDLMTRYIIDNNKELLTQIEPDESKHEDLFAAIDGRTKEVVIDGKKVDVKGAIVDQFNNGEVLVLFGTSAIREGINLQKNCPIMYILQVGFQPVTFMQLHGRIWRQGNPYDNAFLINVLTQNSIDAFVYSKLTQKITSVSEMLEGDVYDANTTQFDVDVNEIKMKLINDPKKLAEMWWDDEKGELSREQIRLSGEVDRLRSLERYYPAAKEKYGKAQEFLNKASKLVHDLEVSILAEIKMKRVNMENERNAINAQVAIDYPAQFKTPKQQIDFEADQEKFRDKKSGQLKFQTKTQVYNDLRGSISFDEITYDEAKDLVISENKAGDAKAQSRLSIVTPTELVESDSVSVFLREAEVFEKALEKAILSRDKLERDLKSEDYRKLGLLVEKTDNAYVESPDDIQEKFVDLFGAEIPFTLANMPKFRVIIMKFVLYATEMQGGRYSWEDYPNNNLKFGDNKVKEVFKEFKTGDAAITIGAFNNLVSNFKLPDGSTATIDDLDAVIEVKQSQSNEAERRLNDEVGELVKKEKQYEEQIKKAQGKKEKSVEEQVESLEVLFPYMNYR